MYRSLDKIIVKTTCSLISLVSISRWAGGGFTWLSHRRLKPVDGCRCKSTQLYIHVTRVLNFSYQHYQALDNSIKNCLVLAKP